MSEWNRERFAGGCRRGMHELIPLGRELMFQAEEPGEIRLLFRE